MKIKINVLDPSSIQNAIDKVQKLQTGLGKAVQDAHETVTEQIIQDVNEKVQTAEYAGYDQSHGDSLGKEDAKVRALDKENSANHASVKIGSESDALNFIEYGTGLQSDMPGSYGQHKGANPKGWRFKNYGNLSENAPAVESTSAPGTYLTKGNKPNRVIYNTIKEYTDGGKKSVMAEEVKRQLKKQGF